MTEEKISKRDQIKKGEKSLNVPISLSQISLKEEKRLTTGMAELDRVLGGGIVPESVILVGGDPGIGKSTLLLQASQKIASNRQDASHFGNILYITGEESKKQIKLRAERMKVDSENLLILTETNLESILDELKENPPLVAVIDSIQTTYTQTLESPPGTISQIRECAAQLINFAKTKGTSIFLVGHVTKEGSIAGPKVLEHMVDTVLYFEGEKNYAYRILRTVKNRFGPSNEIGVFQMEEQGLKEVLNPSQIFLSERKKNLPGSVVVCSIEGTRPILLELQALVSPTNYGVPQRVSTGIDYKRLALLLAILEKREGIHLGLFDVFVNVAGGIRVDEPGVDLGVALALISSFKDLPADKETVVMGEVGLAGEVRAISQIEARIKEAEKLGFKRCVIPESNKKNLSSRFSIEIFGIERIDQTFNLILT